MRSSSHTVYVRPSGPRPIYFTIAVFLWGESVSIDSDGDCDHPTDQEWTELTISNRDTTARVDIDPVGKSPLMLSISGVGQEDVYRAAFYVALTTGGECSTAKDGPYSSIESWREKLGSFDLEKALDRAARASSEGR